MMKVRMIGMVALGASVLGACGESGSSETTRATSVDASPAWILASAPSETMGILEARENAEAGETVAIRGVIGGRKDALSDGAAIFVLIDETLDNPCVGVDDHCPTPWDYCCTPGEVINSSSASVRVVGDDGKTLRRDLRELGIEELDRVVVVGEVGDRAGGGVLNISATGVYVEGG